MKPLIVFLFSCIQYDEGAVNTIEETRKLHFKLQFLDRSFDGPYGGSDLDLTKSIFDDSLHWYDMPTYFIDSTIETIKSKGHHITFDKPFTITLLLIRVDLDRFIINPANVPDSIRSYINLSNVINNINNNKNNNEEIIPIYEEKTFKSDLCAICLEKIPNVLFCSCGHICICEECNKIHKYHTCPVCKTENNILRIVK